MVTSIDFSRITTALSSGAGWTELVVVGACFALGWLLDHRVQLQSASEAALVQVGLSGINRVLMPLATLLLLLVAQAVFRHWYPPFFLAIALPLAVALAIIRLLVFTLRRLFGTPSWLTASERAISFTIWGMVLLYFTGILPVVRTELSDITIPIGSNTLSVYALLRGTLAVVLTVGVTLWLSGLVERRLMLATQLDTNVRAVLGKSVRAVLMVAGVLFALQAVGIDLTVLAVFSGALGVGIGLGLQKLASNYIAGFTILLDRSIRLGDMITVDGRTGVVSRVAARYVVVRNLDGIGAIVPNETAGDDDGAQSFVFEQGRARGHPGAGELRQRRRARAAAAGGGGVGPAPGAARAEPAGRVRRPLRRDRRRTRARPLDRRPRERPAGPAQRDQPPRPGGLCRRRDHDAVPAAGDPDRGRRRYGRRRRRRRRGRHGAAGADRRLTVNMMITLTFSAGHPGRRVQVGH